MLAMYLKAKVMLQSVYVMCAVHAAETAWRVLIRGAHNPTTVTEQGNKETNNVLQRGKMSCC